MIKSKTISNLFEFISYVHHLPVPLMKMSPKYQYKLYLIIRACESKKYLTKYVINCDHPLILIA